MVWPFRACLVPEKSSGAVRAASAVLGWVEIGGKMVAEVLTKIPGKFADKFIEFVYFHGQATGVSDG